MKRIAILTAGGDTPALNATIYGAVERANQLEVEVFGIMKGFSGLLDPTAPHVPLNPLYQMIPELDPTKGGTLIGSSRHYIHPDSPELKAVRTNLDRLKIEGVICIGGDGTINGMQALSDHIPCVLAPKTIDNDLGLNYIHEPDLWKRIPKENSDGFDYHRADERPNLELDEIINYATPGYATAVFVVAQGIQRIRTTAESHRRIAIIEVMGRDSGYIALGSSYGQPDMILIPEVRMNFEKVKERICEIYERQKHAVIVIGEGILDEAGEPLGAKTRSYDPSGNIIFSGAADHLKTMLEDALGDEYFSKQRGQSRARSGIFTRKVGHTQRGGRPIRFDRFYASQLGGQAVDLIVNRQNNYVSTLQWSDEKGFEVSAIHGNKLRDRWGEVHPRTVHHSKYDEKHFLVSNFGKKYLSPIFENALGAEDVEHLRTDIFRRGNLNTPYQSVNIDLDKRIRHLD